VLIFFFYSQNRTFFYFWFRGNLILLFCRFLLEMFRIRPWFWPYISFHVSKPPTAKCAFIGAKNLPWAIRRLNPSPVTLERGFKTFNTQARWVIHITTIVFAVFLVSRSARMLLSNSSPRRPLCYRAMTLSESSNFVRINPSWWILGLQFCRVQFPFHACLCKLRESPVYITCSLRA